MTSDVSPLVRREDVADAAPIRALLENAFGGSSEAKLVDRLRASGDIVLSLVAERAQGGIAGYAAFCRLWLQTEGLTGSAVGLAPLAVATDIQRRGIGGAMLRRGVALLASRGEQLVFVLGDPAYYARFGFDVAAATLFASRYSGPHFMVLRLKKTAPSKGAVRFPSAFDALG